jgi:hypothetical protein
MNTQDPQPANATRRDFLHQAASATAIAALAKATPAAEEKNAVKAATLPTIKLGKHDVGRLIIGGNPMYGHSHFNKLLSAHQRDWHTPERVLALLKRAEEVGINTWQNSFRPRTVEDIDRWRASGTKMYWLSLGNPDWAKSPEQIDEAAKRKPIGIAPHGRTAEDLHRANKLNILVDLLKRIRQTGALVGLSAHNPALIELCEEKGWDVDYYMCCLYYLSRPQDEYAKILGSDLPLGEKYLPSDPPRMFKVIKSVKRPCLIYKILAAGRRIDTPAEVRKCFETALTNCKPTDAVIVGMYNQFSDQVAENATMVREICATLK